MTYAALSPFMHAVYRVRLVEKKSSVETIKTMMYVVIGFYARRKNCKTEATVTREEGGGKGKKSRREKPFPPYETHFIGDGYGLGDYSLLCFQCIVYIDCTRVNVHL